MPIVSDPLSRVPVHARKQFDAFAQLHLRRRLGARVGALALRAAYMSWADGAQANAISLRQMRVLMAARGYPRIKSDRIHYGDVELVAGAADAGR